MINIVYGLHDPCKDEIRYVGKSTSGLRRPLQHATPSELRKRTRKSNWIKSLKHAGLVYEIVVLEELASAVDLDAAERRWIAKGRELDWPLTNATDGGEGTLGRAHTVEARERLSKLNRQIAATPEGRAHLLAASAKAAASSEARAKISAKAKARPVSEARLALLRSNAQKSKLPEVRAKISASLVGRKFSDETRAKLSEANRRRVITPETRAKLSAQRVGIKLRPEHVAAVKAAMNRPEVLAKFRGRVVSAETRARMSAAGKVRYRRLGGICRSS